MVPEGAQEFCLGQCRGIPNHTAFFAELACRAFLVVRPYLPVITIVCGNECGNGFGINSMGTPVGTKAGDSPKGTQTDGANNEDIAAACRRHLTSCPFSMPSKAGIRRGRCMPPVKARCG